MNKKLQGVACAVLGAVLAGGLALTGPTTASSAPVDRDPGKTTGQPTVAPEAGLDPIRVAWENQLAADRAHAAEVAADPQKLAEVLAEKAAIEAEINAEIQAEAGKAHQQQDIRAMCNVGPVDKAPPVSTMGFLRHSAGLIAVIHGACFYVWAGQPGYDNAADGAVFVITETLDGTMSSNWWTFPGTGPLTLTKLTDGGIATLTPVDGKPFTLNVTKS